MKAMRRTPSGAISRWLMRGAALGAASYAVYASAAWLRYGTHKPVARHPGSDSLLDYFLPQYEVTELHHIRVAAPAAVTFRTACATNLMGSPFIQAVFRAREIILKSQPDKRERPKGLVAFTRSLGWATLAEVPDREIVMGAVTQPWQANVVFRPLGPDQFIAFHKPYYVRIAWTLRVDSETPERCVFRTETRVATTDYAARRKFRCYWAVFSPGILLIRRILLKQLKKEAERHALRAQEEA